MSSFVEVCNRCEGAGKITWSSVDGGICYACRGRGRLLFGTNRKWGSAPEWDGETFRIIRNNADSDWRKHSWVVESKRTGLAVEVGSEVTFDDGFPEESKEVAAEWARSVIRSWCDSNGLPSRYYI